MQLLKGQTYRCQNRQCGAEIVIAEQSIEGETNPRCCCGTEMKKPYSPPVLRRLPKDAATAERFLERSGQR